MVKLLSKVGDTPGGKRSFKKTAFVAFLHDEYFFAWEKGRELRKKEREGGELTDAEKEALNLLPSRFGDHTDIEMAESDWIRFFRHSTPEEFFDSQKYPVDNLVKFLGGKPKRDDDGDIIAYSIFDNLKESASSGLSSIIEDPDYDRDRIAGRFQADDGEIRVKVYLKPNTTKAEFFERREKLDSLSSVEYAPKGSD